MLEPSTHDCILLPACRNCREKHRAYLVQVTVQAALQAFEGVLTKLGQALHQGEQVGQDKGLPGATHGASVPMAAGNEDPQTRYSGIRSIRDSSGGWRWIATAADPSGKDRSFPVNAGKAPPVGIKWS